MNAPHSCKPQGMAGRGAPSCRAAGGFLGRLAAGKWSVHAGVVTYGSIRRQGRGEDTG